MLRSGEIDSFLQHEYRETDIGLLRQLKVPWWFALIGPLVLPVMWTVRQKGRRTDEGKCTSCDYNLTGNTSGVCPECGTAVTNKADA
jgi:hypothetical protein